MASYATPADLLKRFDARNIGDLAGDSGTRVSAAAILTDANVLAALSDASGEIDAALLQGYRYSKADLAALTGESLAYLTRLCCQVAFWFLWERRSWTDDERYETAKNRGRAAIEKLRRGEHIFDVTAVKDAGVPKITGPTRVEFRQQNLLRDFCSAVYPNRRLPEGRG